MRQKFNDTKIAAFRATCFGHLDHIDKLAFSGQLLHELSLCRVAKDLKGLTYLIGYEVTPFTKKDFCLITSFGVTNPYDIEIEPFEIRLLREYFPQKFGFNGESNHGRREKGKGTMNMAPKKVNKKILVTYAKFQRAFKERENEDDLLNMGLLCFAKAVSIWANIIVVVNLDYFHLVEDMDEFNDYSWSAISFEQLQDILYFTAFR
ncbi:hypothetical protein DVH24_001606 [Malus domestica]|uniref:DUF1985 domain-containing protein n=1 Tax=Malus domestica TaxID=3750 RepID=A0A498KVP4_MALDO|nr:hypothetical protein DVH24_001606 [Malus domestica]